MPPAMGIVKLAWRGALAGAAGTTALNAASWLSDALPHLAYGAVTVATLDALDPR
jgi:hypothetical protein